MTPPNALHPIDLILRKRVGQEWTNAEIDALIAMVVRYGQAPEAADNITGAQLGSLLMAVFQRGLSEHETANLTRAMRFSGEVFDCSSLGAFTVDKHSTGGVGDKTSLLIAPTLAAAGARAAKLGRSAVAVPMISGRSLGHTGGTLDKLETIPGFSTQLNMPRTMEVLRSCHAVLVGQTPTLVPADRVLYAMRDHTGTVESPYLITASIMSKKLAEDLRGLVLDVKTGSGAFMPSYEQSQLLANLMVATGEASGTRTVALLTTMDEPLGRYSGNWLEVMECVQIMQGQRHALSADLIALSNILSGWMLYLAGHADTPAAGQQLADELLLSGEAYAAWRKIVAAQGGDLRVFDDPAAHHRPIDARPWLAPRAGFLYSMDCKQIGWAIQRLGAGRARPGDPVSAHAGLEVHCKLGQIVEAGQPVFTLYAEDPTLFKEPLAMLNETVTISDEAPSLQPLVREVVHQ
jgi:pyrimidine-nucleoside phosphorylase